MLGSETLPDCGPKALRPEAHTRAALKVKETRTPFCLHNRTIKFQRRLADSLSIKFSFCKHFVALFCAKLITSTLWVSPLKKERHSVNGNDHSRVVSCGRHLRTGARVPGQGRTCREARGMTASRPALACAAAVSVGTGEGQRAAQGRHLLCRPALHQGGRDAPPRAQPRPVSRAIFTPLGRQIHSAPKH